MKPYYQEIPPEVRESFIEFGGRKLAIVGFGIKSADQFQHHPHNFRTHPKSQQKAVEGSLSSLGWVDVVIENRITGNLVDGHERIWNALRQGDSSPVPYLQIELTEAEEAQALLSLDPISAMAGTDRENMAMLFSQLENANQVVEESSTDDFLAYLAGKNNLAYRGQQAGNYSRKVEAPIYEPKQEKPQPSDLYDDSKTLELLAEIEAADLPDDEKDFLRVAARRHTVLNYERVADYYAHSSASVQRLMENSALVIIDFDRAVELGFVRLNDELTNIFLSEYDDV